uniref:Uncharacterized protein n=1 Tax=Octactis speculum TaxID=3111310 RepID=A0A7S2H189_9STRA
MSHATKSLPEDKKSEHNWLNQWSNSIRSKLSEYCPEKDEEFHNMDEGPENESTVDLRVLQGRLLVECERVKTLRYNVLRSVNAIWAAHFDQHRIDWSNYSPTKLASPSDPLLLLNEERLGDLRRALQKLCDSTRDAKKALTDSHSSLAKTVDAVEKTHAMTTPKSST